MKYRLYKRSIVLIFVAICLFGPNSVLAGPTVAAGDYTIALASTPGTIEVGKAKLILTIKDKSSAPVTGALIHVLTKMSSMSMGEQDSAAVEEPGKAGVYTVPAQFAMAGDYVCRIRIHASHGDTTLEIPLSTGMDVGEPAAAGVAIASSAPAPRNGPPYLLLVALLAVAFICYRMFKTGQRASWKSLFNLSTIGSILLLVLIVLAASYAVGKYRRPGAMTPLEAQGMQMELLAPEGAAPVEVATVQSGPIESSLDVSGQAIGMSEQVVSARVTGTIVWMPVYVGDHVTAGQVLARLDTSLSGPQTEAQRAGLRMAEQGVTVARKEYQQTIAAITEAHAEVGMKNGAVEAAQANLASTREELTTARAEQDAASSMLSDAEAQIQASNADSSYWKDEMKREKALLDKGAVTTEEYQREYAQAQNSYSKVQQATARKLQTEAQIRAAASVVRKAESSILEATARLKEAQSELNSHYAHVSSSQAMADSAQQKILQARAGADQAKAMLKGAVAQQAYSEIRATVSGEVTERIVSPGTLIAPGQAILKISQISPIRVQANVAEADMAQIHIGSNVKVSSTAGYVAVAQITSVAPAVDPVSRTGVVEAILPNKGIHNRLTPGEFVRLSIVEHTISTAIFVANRALRSKQAANGDGKTESGPASVWIALPGSDKNGSATTYTAHQVLVKTGVSNGQVTQIVGGLEQGQTVIISGGDYLKEGDTVVVQENVR